MPDRPRLRAVLGVVVLAAAGGLWWWSNAPPADPPPPAAPADDGPLVFPDGPADLGERRGAVSHRVRYVNRGPAPLRVERVDTSCTCTAARPDRPTLAPGEEGHVVLQMDLTKENRGFKRYWADVVFTAGDAPPARRRVELTLVNDPEVTAAPDRLTLSGVAGDVLRGRLTLTDFRARATEVAAVEGSRPEVRAVVAERPKLYLPGWRHAIEVEVRTAALPPGTYHEAVTVRGPDGGLVVPAVPVEVVVTPRVVADRPLVSLAAGDAGGATVVLTDRRPDGTPVGVERVTCDHEAVTWAVEPGPPAGVRLGLKPGSVGAARPATVVIHLSRPCVQDVSVLVSFR